MITNLAGDSRHVFYENGDQKIITPGNLKIEAGEVEIKANTIQITATSTNIDGKLTSNGVDISNTHKHPHGTLKDSGGGACSGDTGAAKT